MRKITFNECPRPQFVRGGYEILDGVWDFAFDKENLGEQKAYFNGFEKEYDILVPFVYQTKSSGINIQTRCDYVWYQRRLNVKKEPGKRVFLHLEGSDYVTKVYVNGKLVGIETGGYHRLSFDITDYVDNGENLLVIKCEDDYSTEKPRGKQRYKDENFECWYVDTTGIYKSVWLEYVSECHTNSVKITPLLNAKEVILEYQLVNADGLQLNSKVYFDGNLIGCSLEEVSNDKVTTKISLGENVYPWSLKTPNLYDLKIELVKNEEVIDQVDSYFGVREISTNNGKIYLNGEELYQKLVLDQGYWLDSHLTPPSNEALYEDIIKMMQLGFNGCRKHQKVEDDRFYYYCDVLGYILWSEMPSMYTNTAKSRAVFEKEWMETVEQHYNHPSVLVWTPLNESWGVRDILNRKVEQDFANILYHVTKEYDPYRLVITNDGWEHTISDIITIHHYEQSGAKLLDYFKTKEKALQDIWDGHHKGAMAHGWEYKGQPIMFTEFGGTAYIKTTEGNSNWGYGIGVKDDEEFVSRFSGLIRTLHSLEYSCGYCYTQVSDVQQEVNGVVFENREFKVEPSLLKKVQDERN